MKKDKEEKKNLVISKNKRMKHSRGITLVALVITIIVLIILAGVSINLVLGEDGIFKRAIGARETYTIASEKEYLEQNVLLVQLEKSTDNLTTEKLGEILYDRNLDNSSKWNIVTKDNTTYGTNWNYVEKGTELSGYGKAQYHWLINYETGEIIQLEDNTYDKFSYQSTIAVDNPVFNLDSANVGLDKSSWGNNATLYYYDAQQYDTVEKRKQAYETEKGKNVTTYVGGYDRQKSEMINEYLDEKTGAFNFNGNNYIEIYNENGFDFSKGLTFEFYGKITGQVAATSTLQENSDHSSCCGLFGLWDGNYSMHCDTRFLYLQRNSLLFYRLIDPINIENGRNRTYGEWDKSSSDPWSQARNIGDIFNKDIYLTITIENKGDDKITQSLYTYIDGERKEVKGWLYKDVYEKFVEISKALHYLELGRCTFGGSPGPNWCYLKGLCYSTRIYNKALSTDEIQANYDVTTAFHQYIMDSKK